MRKNDYNVHSKGAPKLNDTPSTTKTNKKKNTTVASTSKHTSTDKSPKKKKQRENKKEKVKENKVIPSKSPISLDLTQKILGDLNLNYDVVEDLREKMKANIMVFELFKIT